MTPKPTLDLEDLKNKALAATPGKQDGRCIEKQLYPGHYALYSTAFEPVFVDRPWNWIEERFDQIKKNAEYAAAVSPDVVLDLIARVEVYEQTLYRVALPIDQSKSFQEWCEYKMKVAKNALAQPPRTLDKGD